MIIRYFVSSFSIVSCILIFMHFKFLNLRHFKINIKEWKNSTCCLVWNDLQSFDWKISYISDILMRNYTWVNVSVISPKQKKIIKANLTSIRNFVVLEKSDIPELPAGCNRMTQKSHNTYLQHLSSKFPKLIKRHPSFWIW